MISIKMYEKDLIPSINVTVMLLRNGLNRAYCRVSARLKCQFKSDYF